MTGATAQRPGGGAATAPAPQQKRGTRISCTRNFSGWLRSNRLSLAFTSYQSGRLYLAGVEPGGAVAFHERFFARAMGLWASPQTLHLATLFQIWRFENIMAPGTRDENGYDRHYLPRTAHTTGDLDIHDIAVNRDGQVIFVNTLYSCLAGLSDAHSFRPLWQPPFISKLAAEDRCHLNGMAMKDGRASHVTAVCRSDIVNGWRDRRAEGGCLIDIVANEVVTEKLSMPHSPRWYKGDLWLLNSGSGHLGRIDMTTGAFEPVAFCPGFLRGLAFHGDYAIVGLSLPRNGSFSGLELDDELKRRDAEPWCGIQVVSLKSGDIVEWIRLEGEVTELFDVAVLPGVVKPMCTGFLTNDIHHTITIES